MTSTVTVGAAIFFLGAAVGALLTRLQWIAFKQKVSQELMEHLGGKPSIESEPTRVGHPNVATFITPWVDDSRSASAELCVARHTSSEIVASRLLKSFLEQDQMEIDGLLREVRALWDDIDPLGNDRNRTERRNCSDRRSPRVKYARWFSPNRALKPH
jgi:chorismate synthase